LNSLLFDIRHYTIHDGPGIRTTVFFKGCPLRCRWCHNPESQDTGVGHVKVSRELDGRRFENQLTVGSWQLAGEVMKEIAKDDVFYRESGGGVTFSGGEPLMQAEALQELLVLCREQGYKTAIDTCGHAEPAALHTVMELADLWLFDLKLMDDIKHVEYTGVSNELALQNLETIANRGKEIVIRFPLIPGITDTIDNTREVAQLMLKLGLKRIDILPFHDIARYKYLRTGKEYMMEGVAEPSAELIEETVKYFMEFGIDARVGGG
jgi:pyruvate formate lyase activating enzyme